MDRPSMIACTVRELLTGLSRGDFNSEKLTIGFLDVIAQREPRIRAFLAVDRQSALAQARAVDEKRQRGKPLGALAGIPIAVKDVLCTQGQPTTCGSRILQGFVPPFDAHVISKL